MKQFISLLVVFMLLFSSKGQHVGINTNNPHPSAALDISSNNSGFLPPRMSTAERNGQDEANPFIPHL